MQIMGAQRREGLRKYQEMSESFTKELDHE